MIILLILLTVLTPIIVFTLYKNSKLSLEKRNLFIKIYLILLIILGIVIYFCFPLKTVEQFSTPIDEVFIISNILSNKDINRLLQDLPSQKFYTARHNSYPTTDFPVHHIPWLEEKIASSILFEKIAQNYNVDINDIWLRDAFVIKYNTQGQSSLKTHIDQSRFSFILQISDPDKDFTGGGTSFILPNNKISEPLSAPVGGAIIFKGGEKKHLGKKVETGERIIIAGFVDHATNYIQRPHLLYNIKKMMKDANTSTPTEFIQALRNETYIPPNNSMKMKFFIKSLKEYNFDPNEDIETFQNKIKLICGKIEKFIDNKRRKNIPINSNTVYPS